MYTIYVNNTLPLALAVHKISRHFWAAYAINKSFEINTSHKECVLPVMRMGWGDGIEC